LQDAATTLRTIVGMYPEDSYAHLLLLDTMLEAYNYEEAEKIATKLPARHLDAYIKGKIALSKRDYRGAVERFNAIGNDVIPMNPVTIAAELAAAYAATGDNSSADQALMNIRKTHRNSPDLLLARARVSLLLSNNESAIALADSARRASKSRWRFPSFLSESYLIEGKANHNLGNQDLALSNFQFASSQCKLCPDPVFESGLVFDETGDSTRAIASLLKSIELSPRYPQLKYELAKIYENAGKNDDAIKQYEHFLKLNPPEAFATDAKETISRLRTIDVY